MELTGIIELIDVNNSVKNLLHLAMYYLNVLYVLGLLDATLLSSDNAL